MYWCCMWAQFSDCGWRPAALWMALWASPLNAVPQSAPDQRGFCVQLLKVCRSCQVLFEMLSVTWSRVPGWVAFPLKHSSYFSCWAFLLLLLLFWYQSGFDSQGKCWQTELLEFHVLDHAEQCLNIWNTAISACVIAVSESEHLMCSFLFSFFFFLN